jgi:hypothetical protein
MGCDKKYTQCLCDAEINVNLYDVDVASLSGKGERRQKSECLLGDAFESRRWLNGGN